MSLGNKYLNNTIRARYNDDTPDAILSKQASNLLVSFEDQGYKILNTKDFYPNTIPESKYACYDASSLASFLLYQDTFFQLAFEKFDDIQRIYKAIVRHFLLKVDGSVWIKQVVFAYPRSIFTLSDSDRATYTKTLLALPGYNEFTTYYSSIYALKTAYPSLPMPCTLGIGSGCFISELKFYVNKYNEESNFGSGNLLPDSIKNDMQDLSNGFYYLCGQDITRVPYPVTTNYTYNAGLWPKPYSSGSAPFLNNSYMLHYIADNQIIRDNQTFYDTQSLSPGDPRKEPPSSTQPVNNQNNNGSGSGSSVSTNTQGDSGYQPPFIGSNYGDTPNQYGNPAIIDGVNPEDMGYYQGDTTPVGINGLLDIYNQMCPPGFGKESTDYNGVTTIGEVGEGGCQCNKVI